MNKINERRRELLLKIDNNEEIDQNALIMYGLTPYVKTGANTGMRLMDFRLENHDISRKLQHDSNISFMPEQQSALNQLDLGDRILFMAPTSFGKSLIIKEYIWRYRPRNVVYIVPTNSLAFELEKSYKKTFTGVYEIFDSSSEQKNGALENLLFIGTQEKYIKLRTDFKEIDLVVIDEAYKLKDELTNERCMALSKVLLEDALEKSNKVVLLLPNAKVSGISEFKFKVIDKKFNAVDKKIEKYKDINSSIKGLLINKKKTIVYFASPADMKSSIKKLQNTTPIEDTHFMKHLKDEYSEDFNVYKAMKHGVLVHHGQIPKYVQNKIISIFNNHEQLRYTMLFGTRSISEGINTPTQYIVFDPKVDVSNDKMLVKNTMGRAGRLGMYPIGRIACSAQQYSELTKVDDTLEIKISASDNTQEEKVKSTERLDNLEELFKSANYFLSKESLLEIENMNIAVSKVKKIIDFIDQFLEKENPKYYLYNLYSLHNFVHADSNNKHHLYLKTVDQRVLDSWLYNYKFINDTQHELYSFKEKINYIMKLKSNELEENNEKKAMDPNCKLYRHFSVSEEKTIDLLFKHRYTTLEYKLIPLATICEKLLEVTIDEKKRLLLDSIVDVKIRYAKVVLKRANYEQLSAVQKEVLIRLTEYGIPSRHITDEMLQIIEGKINNRYSMYDINNIILKENQKANSVFKNIVNIYL